MSLFAVAGGVRAALRTRAALLLAVLTLAVLHPVVGTGATGPVTLVPLENFGWGVAVNPLTNRAYAANGQSNSVSVVDTLTNTVIATISVRTGPSAVAVDTALNRIYVTHNQSPGGVTIINGQTHAIVTSPNTGNWTTDVAINPVTQKAYVANEGSQSVSVIDTTTGAVIRTISGSFNNPSHVGVNPSTNRVYVSNWFGNSVSVIDGSTDSVIRTVPVGDGPRGVLANPATNRIYVANARGGTTSIIDGVTNTVTATLTPPPGATPYEFGINPATNRIYQGSVVSTTIAIIDGDTDTIVDTTAVGVPTVYVNGSIDVNPLTNTVYVVNSSARTLSVFEDDAPVPAAGPGWSVMARTTPRQFPAAGVVNGTLIVATGNDNQTHGAWFRVLTTEIYYPAANTWLPAAPIPTPLYAAGSGGIGNKLYVAGGQSWPRAEPTINMKRVQIYDSLTNTWSSGTDMPEPVGGMASAVYNGKLYIAGGRDASNGADIGKLFIYDPALEHDGNPATNPWTEDAPMAPREMAAATFFVGQMYVLGGQLGGTVQTVVQAYNPNTHTWIAKAPLNIARAGATAAVVGGTLYAFGGNAGGTYLDSVERYDPSAGQTGTDGQPIGAWTVIGDSMPSPLSAPATGVIDDVLYLAGGRTVGGGFSSATYALSVGVATDTDGDGTPDNADTNDDNDAALDVDDAFPLDASETVDTDGDGLGDNADTNDDNDAALDVDDAFPLDASETVDTDGDGLGNNADPNDDNDAAPDATDAFPLDASETVDTDGDGLGNNADSNDDNDAALDANDAFPLDASETVDTDGDGTGNNADPNDDNDAALDVDDAFPLDASETVDTDGDGTGNNADLNDDNDAAPDATDAFPLDASETVDTDGDGLGNNADPNDDNDAALDVDDAFPLDASETVDTDGDGLGNNADPNDDNDAALDVDDAFPLDASETLDTDGDGIGNNTETDDDADGIADAIDRNRTTGADESTVVSSDYFKSPTTSGTITRNGWTVDLVDLGARLQATLSGAGTAPARIAGCTGTPKFIQLDAAGERATFTCSGTGTLSTRAVTATPFVEVRKLVCYDGCFYQTVASLRTNRSYSTGSPSFADPDSEGPVDVAIIDGSTGVLVGGYTLDPGEGLNLEMTPGPNGQPKVGITVLSGTVPVTVYGQTRTLTAGSGETVFVQDAAPPVIAPAPDVFAEATSPDGAVVSFALPLVTDDVDPAPVVTASPPSGSQFPLGTTTVTVRAIDAVGRVAEATFPVTVRDTTAPTISTPSVDTPTLWPPNHQMVTVTVAYVVSDLVTAQPACSLTVRSNEPIDGLGDGDTAPDWQILDDHRVRLRAERRGGGSGRIYTITVQCADGAGNATERDVLVTVPRNQRR